MTQATRCVAAHRVDDIAFSPDAKSVAIASTGWFVGGLLQLFDIDSGTVRWRYRRRARTVDFTKGAFSADGSLLCVGGWDKATILDAGDGHVVRRCGVTPRNNSPFTHAYISPDGTWLISLLGRKGRAYDVRSGAETLRFRLSADCHGLRYSPDGTRIATLGEDGIDVWDAASFQVQVARTRSWSRPRSVDFDDRIARLQNVPAKTNRVQFGGCSHVLVTAAAKGHSVTAAAKDSVIRVWDVASGTLTGLCDTAPGTEWLTLGDGTGRVALTSCTDGTLRVWDVTTGQERARLPTPQGFRFGAVNSDATKLATSNGGKSVEIWSIAAGPGQQPAPDAAAPDDWCHHCGAESRGPYRSPPETR
jgi:WD40 repeat protein